MPEVVILTGDCVQGMNKRAATADVIFADPPYNYRLNYGAGEDADNLPEDEYLIWTEGWLSAAHKCLKSNGSLWVVCPDEWVSETELFCRRKLGMERRNWVKWYETFGNNATKKFNRTSRHLLYFVKGPGFLFDPSSIRVQSARQVLYKDARANPDGKVPDDVWQIPRVAGTFRERLAEFPTQLPLELVTRAVSPCVTPGMKVVDPFCGSGTTGEAAVRLGCDFLGFDLNAEYAAAATERVRKVVRDLDTVARIRSGKESVGR